MASWLITEDGTRLRVGRGGVLIGRRSSCDLVVPQKGASRRHALVRAAASGGEVVHFGRGPTHRNGVAVQDVAPLTDGDQLEIAGFTVRFVADAADSEERQWVLESAGGTLWGVTRTPFVVGSAAASDLEIAGWPAEAARFHALPDSLVVELCAPGRVRDVAVASEEFVGLGAGDRIEFGGVGLRVLAPGLGSEGTTHLAPGIRPPTAVSLHFHERGGLLSLHFGCERLSVHLPDRRCDLVAALLRPPGDRRAGDFVSDDELAPRVWPGQFGKGRTDLNLLLHRTRRSLLEAGIDGPALLERGRGGGETRFVLPRDVPVTVE